jgi:hypothetical protein
MAPTASARGADCDVTLSTAQVDYGRLSRATLAAGTNGRLALPLRTVGLHIRCPEPQDMAVRFRGVAANDSEFRFTDIGRFSLRLRDGSLDGERVNLGQIDGGVPGPIDAALPWTPDQALAPVKNGRVTVGRDFTAQIDIAAEVDERALTPSDAVRWAASGSVEAASASPRELSLQADVQPGRCSVDVVRHVAFSQLRSTDLDRRGASTRVPAARSGELRVMCDAPMPFAFRVMRDERAGTAVAPVGVGATYTQGQLFGLGRTPGGNGIGAYVLHWAATAASDHGELHATHSIDGGKSWADAGGTVLADHASGARMGYAGALDAAMGPSAVRSLDVTLDATIFVAPVQTLPINEEIRADGLVTFEIVY